MRETGLHSSYSVRLARASCPPDETSGRAGRKGGREDNGGSLQMDTANLVSTSKRE